MDIMNRLFRSYLDSFVIAFTEKVLVYLKNESEHMGHLKVVLQVLKEKQLFANYSKCEFCLRSVVFLGHIISSEGVEVDRRKMEAVKNCPRPLTPTDIRRFLGLANYFQRFMDDFTSIVSPLNTLTQESKKFEWLEACERIFQILKDMLNSAPVLTLPKGTMGFLVYCDSSRVCLGCMLKQ